MRRLRISRLAKLLERSIPPIKHPDPNLEQYTTPGELAARLAILAALAVEEPDMASALDLGSGTCRIAAALALVGFSRVVAVELDQRLLPLCLEGLRALGIGSVVLPVNARAEALPLPEGRVDVVAMNPPFGVWRRRADTRFLMSAFRLRPVRVVAILKGGNTQYFERLARRWGYRVAVEGEYLFPIPASMPKHRSRIRRIAVEVIVFDRE
ncbi:MAG: methyltransferase domain-containing protein [Desulfurococcales archaeon]|nr:methyltransferase domain-containing protein [Desulfurococcales archaeon]